MAMIRSRDIKNENTKRLKELLNDLKAEYKFTNNLRLKSLIKKEDTSNLESDLDKIEEEMTIIESDILNNFVNLEIHRIKRFTKIFHMSSTQMSTRNDLEYITVGEEVLGKKVNSILMSEIKNKLSFLIIFDDESFCIKNEKHEDVKSLQTYSNVYLKNMDG